MDFSIPFLIESIRVYDCYNVATWKSHEVSWNNQPFNNSDNGYKSTTGAVWLASKTASDSASYYTFTITDMVLDSLHNGTENTIDCDGCLGEGCLGCTGYNVDDAIFLVTGHSLGAAIANLTAAHLNNCNGASCEYCSYSENGAPQITDVYSYTFGTPNVLDGAIEGNEKIEYENIFNILNNNDTVTFVPHSFDINKWNIYLCIRIKFLMLKLHIL